MRRGVLILLAAVAAIGLFTGGLAWLLTDARPPVGATRAQRLYYAYCVECHGVDGRGSWRAKLFLLRPGDLTDRARIAAESDRYLFDLIKNGGATIGRSGMPAFGAQLSDDDIALLVRYIRELSSTPAPRADAKRVVDCMVARSPSAAGMTRPSGRAGRATGDPCFG